MPGANAPTPSVILPVPPVAPAHEEPAIDIQTRRLRLQKRDFMKYGYTAGCPGCINLQRDQPSRNHSEICRQRIENMISSDEEEMARKQYADSRLEGQFTRALEREEELLAQKDATLFSQDAPTEGETPFPNC